MIANCGQMGLDWRYLSLSGYLEALEAANEMQQPSQGASSASPVSERFKRFAQAHGVGGG